MRRSSSCSSPTSPPRLQPDCQPGRHALLRTRVPCPITVRLPSGGTSGSGPFHSQSMEGIYAHYPGLIVMTPATVEDAYSMLLEAVAMMTRSSSANTSTSTTTSRRATAARGHAHRQSPHCPARSRHDHSSPTAPWSTKPSPSPTSLASEGAEIEVVDLRSVKPLDTDSVMASVARTGRLLCVGEAWPWGGVTAEVVARVASEGFDLLDAPPQRLNAKDTPVPYHPDLWALIARPRAASPPLPGGCSGL